MFKISLAVAVAGGCLGMAGLAQGAMLDLTAAGSSGSINGALFSTNEQQPTGTGVFQPFVRIQANGFEHGYNTSGSPLPFDEKSGIWTHDLRLSDMGITSVSGVAYYEFRLDVNESNGGTNSLISLDRVQIYTSGVGSMTAASDAYVYFYSAFGTNHPAGAGFEEWSAKQAVPAPASTALALMGMAIIGRRKR
jgi:hypothetical protein